jgi:hypothetical protein
MRLSEPNGRFRRPAAFSRAEGSFPSEREPRSHLSVAATPGHSSTGSIGFQKIATIPNNWYGDGGIRIPQFSAEFRHFEPSSHVGTYEDTSVCSAAFSRAINPPTCPVVQPTKFELVIATPSPKTGMPQKQIDFAILPTTVAVILTRGNG